MALRLAWSPGRGPGPGRDPAGDRAGLWRGGPVLAEAGEVVVVNARWSFRAESLRASTAGGTQGPVSWASANSISAQVGAGGSRVRVLPGSRVTTAGRSHAASRS